ncbi:MAG: hypothetical protein IPM12_05680 [Flavobacteriales bacterium]|nr:hypothetical protein [Flavobacteriales bacterium]
MSNGALDRPTFEAIESYVLDRMDALEREAFEQRLAGDADLRAEVELERENIRAVELGGVTRMLKGIVAEDGAQASGTHWSRYLKYAAVIAVLISGAIWWSMRPSLNERLFAEHFAADPGLPVAMSATADPAFADAMVSYKEGNYAEARAKWSPLLQAEPMNDTLRYYIASAHMAEGDARAAEPMLAALANEGASVFQAKARWFLFLSYVRTGEGEKALAIPLDADTVYSERARLIKAQLQE